MKEFIDKLIGRLEEEQEYQYQKSDEADVIEEITVKKARRKMGDCYDSAIQIVNQLAEEYKGGFCEWRKQTIGGIELIREPHRMYLFKTSEDEWVFCPYCGKKIIVAPYTEGE